MAKQDITVYLLNFHSGVTHIELLLETKIKGVDQTYVINRWVFPEEEFCKGAAKVHINYQEASSRYQFTIQADPASLVQEWKKYFYTTFQNANIITQNCADAAQWFLTYYADIPKPHFLQANLSTNHLILGLQIPSFFPIGITLAGRVMDNAKFYLEARKNPTHLSFFKRSLFQCGRLISALLMLASLAAFALSIVFSFTIAMPLGSFALLLLSYTAFKFFQNTLFADTISKKRNKSTKFITAALDGEQVKPQQIENTEQHKKQNNQNLTNSFFQAQLQNGLSSEVSSLQSTNFNVT